MLISSLHEPSLHTCKPGDYWYCYADRHTYEYVPSQQVGSTAVPACWSPHLLLGIVLVSSHPPMQNGPSLGPKIWINSNDLNQIPQLYDAHGGLWIPVVPLNFTFPPLNPTAGDAWHDAMIYTDYVYNGSDWILVPSGSTGNYSLGIQGSFNVNATPPATLLATPPASPSYTYAPVSSHSILNIVGYVDIRTDGSIIYDPQYTPDTASQMLWHAISKNAPTSANHVDLLAAHKKIEHLSAINDEYKELVAKCDEMFKYAEDRGFKFPSPEIQVDPNDAWDAAMGVVSK